MGLIRLFIILFIAWLAYSLTRRWLASLQNKQPKKPDQVESMVRCHHCGLHIPQHEAIHAHGHNYCSNEHRKLAGD